MLRQGIIGAAAVSAAAFFYDFYAKAYRVYHFYYGNRKIVLNVVAVEVWSGAEAVGCGFRLEYAYIAFASEEDNLFVEYRDAFNVLRFAHIYAGLECASEEEPNVDLVKTAVEGYRFNRYMSPYNFGVFAADIRRVVYDFLRIIRKEHL